MILLTGVKKGVLQECIWSYRSHWVCVSHNQVENALQEELPLDQVHTPTRCTIIVKLVLNGWTLSMQVDTGAAVSLILSATFTRLFPNAPLSKTAAILTTYTGEQLPLAWADPGKSNGSGNFIT